MMLHTFHALPAQEGEAGLIARWETIRAVRAEGLKVIEALRTEGKVGASLQAELELALTADKFAALASLGEDLRFAEDHAVEAGGDAKQVGDRVGAGV